MAPLAWTVEERAVRPNHNYRGIAKLKPGVDVARVQADLDTISKRLAEQYPEDNKDWGALVLPLHQTSSTTCVPRSFCSSALSDVLLIACANVANLLLVRTHGRAKELAMRSALGASRGLAHAHARQPARRSRSRADRPSPIRPVSFFCLFPSVFRLRFSAACWTFYSLV